MEDLYDSEINFCLSSFYDAGYTVQIGDNINGFVDESEMIQTLEDVADGLIRMVLKHYPKSEFEKKYQHK